MDKIKTLFIRDTARPQFVTTTVDPDAAWVLAGEGVPTRKRDGTNICIEVREGVVKKVWKRRNPTREEKAQGAEPGYVEASRGDPGDKHIFAAVDATDFSDWPDGSWSCEALGPKIQGGWESSIPMLYPFSWRPERIADCERSFDGIREFLRTHCIEGIVWRHPDGRMAKIKRRDFGLKWPGKRLEEVEA
jgi:hypothetical protein